MTRPRYIEDLADELLSSILSFLLGPERLWTSPHAHHSKPNGNGTPASHGHGEQADIDRFRLVCKRFARIGTPRKFHRFVLRFSSDGFDRLEELLSMQLACHVKYFTYMVRPFYQGSGWPLFLTGVDAEDIPSSQLHARRLYEQESILSTNRDLLVLQRAISAFPSLTQIKLLRLQDSADETLSDYLHYRFLQAQASLTWTPACTRAITTLSTALMHSSCTSLKFIAPHISPEATISLLNAPIATLSAVASKLTTLDITFHPVSTDTDTDNTISSHLSPLSQIFHSFFLAARNLVTIHLGFPAKTPLDLPLESIFHRVQWKRLRTLGIQGWRLTASELIAFIRRHSRQIRELRLLNIYLRDGSWSNILSVLRDEMEYLERIDLREIDYANHFDSIPTANGHLSNHVDVPFMVDADLPITPPLMEDVHLSISPKSQRQYAISEATMERLRGLSVKDLDDDGVCVKREQRVLWEAWVLSGQRDNNIVRRY